MSTKLEIPEWTGSTLTVGAFSEYAGRIVGSFKHHGYEALALNEIGPALEAAQQRLADFVNRERAYDETPEVAKADANRDALWKAFYYVWHYLMQLDPSHALYQEAVKLRSEMTPYKGVYKHELSKETAELRGLRRDLDKPLPHDAIMMLGLDRIVSALFQANETVASIIEDRDAERGNRIAEKGGDTTASLRKAVVTLLIDAYRQVNAAARINDSEQTRNAVSEVNGIIAHYKDVAAQPAKHKGGDEPAPEPEPEASAS